MEKKSRITKFADSLDGATDSLQKREKFAIGLRKKKTQELVKAKRRKFLDTISKSSRKETYRGYAPWFDANNEPMKAILNNLAP